MAKKPNTLILVEVENNCKQQKIIAKDVDIYLNIGEASPLRSRIHIRANLNEEVEFMLDRVAAAFLPGTPRDGAQLERIDPGFG